MIKVFNDATVVAKAVTAARAAAPESVTVAIAKLPVLNKVIAWVNDAVVPAVPEGALSHWKLPLLVTKILAAPVSI